MLAVAPLLSACLTSIAVAAAGTARAPAMNAQLDIAEAGTRPRPPRRLLARPGSEAIRSRRVQVPLEASMLGADTCVSTRLAESSVRALNHVSGAAREATDAVEI